VTQPNPRPNLDTVKRAESLRRARTRTEIAKPVTAGLLAVAGKSPAASSSVRHKGDDVALLLQVMQVESAVADAVMSSPIALHYMLDLGRRVRAGVLTLSDVLGDMRNDDPRALSREATERFLAQIARICRLDRERRHLLAGRGATRRASALAANRLRQRVIVALQALRPSRRHLGAIVNEMNRALTSIDHAAALIANYERRFGMPIKQVLARCRALTRGAAPTSFVLSPLRINRRQAEVIEAEVAHARRQLRALERAFEVTQDALARSLAIIRLGEERAAQARRQLIKTNRHLVLRIAGSYCGRGVHFGELIRAGNVGLMKAVDRFDPGREITFAAQATWWIHRAISRLAFRRPNPRASIRLPRARPRLSARSSLALGTAPVSGAAVFGRRLRMLPEGPREVPTTGAPSDMAKMTETTRRMGAAAGQSMRETPAGLRGVPLLLDTRAVLATLAPREEEILRLRFGIGKGAAQTHVELARRLSLSGERIRQIELNALRKLRHPGCHRRL
jgi:RNA polymerase primary sigma factor